MLYLHVATLIFGFAGLTGKMLTVSPSAVVFARTVVGAFALALVWGTSSSRKAIDRDTVFRLLPSGVLLGLHWLTFFVAVKVSTVAIGLLSFATFPVFVAFLEPLFSRVRLCLRDVGLAFVVFVGLVLVVPSYSLGDHMFQGALWGLLSAVLVALVTCINKRVVGSTDPIVVGLLQNVWAAFLFLPASGGVLSMTGLDVALIVFLGVGCSAIGHTLFVAALRSIRAELAAVTSGLEPLYGIILGYLLLGEVPTVHTVIGGALIVLAVTVASIWDSRKSTLMAVG